MPQRSSSSLSLMVLLLLCTVTRRASGFHHGSVVPTHTRRAMASFTSSWALPLSSPSSSSSSRSSSHLHPLSLHHRFLFLPATSTALFATSSASSGAGKKKKAPSSKAKGKAPPVKKIIDEDEDEEEDDEDEMTEAELLKVMQSEEAMDAVWQRMMSQMEGTGALEGEDEEEDDDDDDSDDDEEEDAEEELSDEEDSDNDDENDESDAENTEAMDRKRGLSSSPSSFSENDEEEEDDNLGTIQIRNSQRSIALDMDLLHNHMRGIMEIIGKPDHDVSLWLTNDRSIREYNDRYRGKRSATDILSFPFHEYKTPGMPTPESMALNGQIKDLGDMMVSTAYVQRQCERDQADWVAEGENQWSEERGASGAMARVYDVQGRLPFLVIHGALHLLGYDHETETEYEEMVREEERVIKAFVERFPEAAPPAPVAVLKKEKEGKKTSVGVEGEGGGKTKSKVSGAGATTTTAVKKSATAASAKPEAKAAPGQKKTTTTTTTTPGKDKGKKA